MSNVPRINVLEMNSLTSKPDGLLSSAQPLSRHCTLGGDVTQDT